MLNAGERPDALIRGFDIEEETPEGFHRVTLATSHGSIACRYYPVAEATSAAVWIGGVGGGWDSPARGLYPRLCRDLRTAGIASLRVQFRHPTDLDASVFDVLAGIGYLQKEDVPVIGIGGHSFGGAVAIQTAAAAEAVQSVVTLATQSYGTDVVDRLAPRCPILLIHGTADRVLPPSCSEQVYAAAAGVKRLHLIDGADHGLDAAAEQVHRLARDWMVEHLGGAPARS